MSTGSPRGARPREAVAAAVAAVVLLHVGADLAGVAPLPEWVAVGGVRLPILVVGPAALSVAVLAVTVRDQQEGPVRRYRVLEAMVAVVTLGLALVSVVELNVFSPDVFWTGAVAVTAGVALAVVVLIGAMMEAARRSVTAG